MPFQVGQRVGDYEVVQLLGAGGMGHVYRVRNIISNRTEAMKVLLPDLTAEPDLATRFISEIRTLAGFDHPNIAQLHTAFQADNQLIMMMEFVEGYTLEQIAKQRNMPMQEVAGFVSQALAALAYAHERGVIHRDIKPANLMVTSHGIVKLMDFGIAKSSGENDNHTKPGTTMGSLYYMSPEQVRGAGVDPRSDIYSVGIVLYELLAGRRPFEAETTFSILNAQLNTLPQPPIEVNPSLPQGLNEVIMRSLAKDPNQRFQNADEFRNALRPFCNAPNGQQVFAPITQPMPSPTPVPQAEPPQAQQSQYAQVPQQPPPRQGQPQYGGQPYGGVSMAPPQRQGGGKALWITTGAVAVILALVGIGYAVPHMFGTHAASSTASSTGATTADTSPPSTPSFSTAPTDNPTTAAPTNTSPSGAPTSTGNSGMMMSGSPSGTAKPHAGTPSNHGTVPMSGSVVTAAPVPTGNPVGPPPANNNAALDEASERLMQLQARASSAKRGVAQIRSQQEAMGLGLRGDVESAESRLDSYLQAANNDLNRGNAAGAAQKLDKADAELSTLEKFLGR